MLQSGWPPYSKLRKLEVSSHGLIDEFSKGLDHQMPKLTSASTLHRTSLSGWRRWIPRKGVWKMKLRHIISTISYRHLSRKIRGRQPAKPSGIYLPWFSLSFLIFSTYTNVTKIRSTICSPSGKISSEVGCGSLDRRRWYEATRLSLPSPMTSCNYIHQL